MSDLHADDVELLTNYRLTFGGAPGQAVIEDLVRTYVLRSSGYTDAVDTELANIPEPYRSVAEKAQRLVVLRIMGIANKANEVKAI